MEILYYAVAVLGLLIVSCCGKAVEKVGDDNHFDYLLFAQFWPASSCIYFEEKHESCFIPPYVRGWTVHGLWPSRPDSELPQACNSSMPFDYSQISSLRSQLDKNWHFYDSDKDATYLWQHEWEKHGTCAYSLDALKGEMNYFKRTLQLHSTVNVTLALEKSNILPSETATYKREDFYNAINKFFNFKPVIVCDYDRKVHKTYIDQVYLCFTKDFQQQDCYPPQGQANQEGGLYQKCLEQDDIYYMPFNKNQQQQPKQASNSLKFESEFNHHH